MLVSREADNLFAEYLYLLSRRLAQPLLLNSKSRLTANTRILVARFPPVAALLFQVRALSPMPLVE